MNRLITALICLLAISGCSSLQALGTSTTGTIASVAPDELNAAKRSLTAAHDLHRSLAVFLSMAATSNLCHAGCAATAKNYLDQSEAILMAGDGLIKLGDAKGIEAKITAAAALMAQAQALVGK